MSHRQPNMADLSAVGKVIDKNLLLKSALQRVSGYQFGNSVCSQIQCWHHILLGSGYFLRNMNIELALLGVPCAHAGMEGPFASVKQITIVKL